jgi:type II secretory pathway pseudopilin PulG
MRNICVKLVATILFGILSASASPSAQAQRDDAEARLRAARKHANLLSTQSGANSGIRLNCSDARKKQTLSGLLAKLPVALPVTIRVSGACQDNVSIIGFEHVTLVAEPGASISDASGQGDPVIFVSRTTTFEMQGLTINGGEVDCVDFSTCYFSGNTVQNAPGNGFNVDQSSAEFSGDVATKNGNVGLRVSGGSVASADSVSILNNAGFGSFVNFGSTLIGSNMNVQNNALGLRLSTHAVLMLSDSNVSNNLADGIFVLVGSEGYFSGNTINGNGQAGVRVRDLSMVVFPGGSDVTGNLGGTDVVCEGQFGAARDTATSINGGTSNCTPE